MSDERIDPEAIRAAIEAFGMPLPESGQERMEAAIRAADAARGLRAEERVDMHPSHQAIRSWRSERKVRYVSDWRPVERPS